jgi:hypothetical protein
MTNEQSVKKSYRDEIDIRDKAKNKLIWLVGRFRFKIRTQLVNYFSLLYYSGVRLTGSFSLRYPRPVCP